MNQISRHYSPPVKLEIRGLNAVVRIAQLGMEIVVGGDRWPTE
ncbi:MAG: hypothetical protein WCB36_04065 [Burkholderiales bacterium]